MPDNIIWTALITAFVGILSPLLMAWQVNRNQRVLKKLDWDRQDQVANRLEEAAKTASARATEVAAALIDSNQLIADSAKETGAQLKQIHTLVNSDKTAGMERERVLLRANSVLQSSNLKLMKMQGVEPSDEEIAALETTNILLAELEKDLEERAKQTKAAERQLAADTKG
jgi:hypothetical protein